MLSNILTTRLFLAALPSLICAQSMTTLLYTYTTDGAVSSIVISLPLQGGQVETTIITQASATVTSTTALRPSVETTTITLTGPVSDLSSAAAGIPASYQLQQPSIAPGPVIPITVHGYTTSLQLPSSVSLPSTAITIAPSAAATSASRATSSASEQASQASTSINAQASQASSPLSQATSQAGSSLSAQSSQASSSLSSAASEASSSLSSTESQLPTVVPVPNPNAASLQNSVSQATTMALTTASVSSTSTVAASAGSVTTTTSVPTGIVTDTSTAPSTMQTSTTTSSSAASTTTQTSQAPQSTSTSATQARSSSPPQSSSTAAPSSGAVFRASFAHGFLGAVVLGVGLSVF